MKNKQIDKKAEGSNDKHANRQILNKLFCFDGTKYKVQIDRWMNGQLDKVINGQAESRHRQLFRDWIISYTNIQIRLDGTK